MSGFTAQTRPRDQFAMTPQPIWSLIGTLDRQQ